MKIQKHHYAVCLVLPLILAFTASAWVGESIKEQEINKDHRVLKESFDRAFEKPEKFASPHFKLVSNKEYSSHAYAKASALILADTYRKDQSVSIYSEAMHRLNEENIKEFLFLTYDRLMENDRDKYETSDSRFPDEVQKNINRMFSERPVFVFSQEENIAIIKCVEFAKNELKERMDGISVLQKIASFINPPVEHQGCHPLMKLHKNIHL